MAQQPLSAGEILRLLMRRRWLLISLPVFAALAAGFLSAYGLSPVYRVSTTLWVIKDQATGPMQYSDLLFSQNLTRTYAEVARSRTVAEATIRSLGLDGMTADELQKQFTVTAVRDTQILAFTVQDHDPVMAAKLADGLAEAFMAEIRGFMQVRNVRLVDRAVVPLEPVSPRPVRSGAVGLILGLMAAAGAVFLLEVLDVSVKTPEDVAHTAGVPVLGSIPAFEAVTDASTRTGPSMLVAAHAPASAASEAFRVLRTNLQFQSLDQPVRSILVTSAAPGEGKSTIAANLAVAFAHAGARVCLVEADLRRPVLARMLGLSRYAGVTTALISRGDPECHIQESGTDGLHVMTSGPIPPNPAELLGTQRMAALLRRLEQQYDIVLLDSPPVLAVADTAVLAPLVGGVLLVARSGRVSRQHLAHAREALAAVRARTLGVVMSAMPVEEHRGYYYHY